MINMVTFAPKSNTAPKKDATGAFHPEQRAFSKLWAAQGATVESVVFDNSGPNATRRSTVLGTLAMHRDLRCVAFFCHGLRRSIQAGFALDHVEGLAAGLDRALAPSGVVVLYACDVGRDGDAQQEDDLQPGPGGEGGFADILSDVIAARRQSAAGGWAGWVDGHSVAGHSTMNRYVRRFRGRADGGDWIVEPKSSRWKRWGQRLRDPKDDLRLRFPLMHEDAIRAELDR